MDYQWYPGHMAKARRQMQEDMKLVDLVIELTDARIPASGRNSDIDGLARGKARLILLNKADLADEAVSRQWIRYFTGLGFEAVELDARNRKSMKKIMDAVMEACKEKLERDRRRGIKNRPIRAMVAGIPNVGKSTFINSIAGKSAAKTGNKPGVTKGRQWVRLNKNLELLDTPGILVPKFEDPLIGRNLALIGSLNDQNLNMEELALELMEILRNRYPGRLNQRYGIEETGTGAELLEKIAAARNCLKKGGETDYKKAADLLMDEFRSGRLGRISLERPEDEKPVSE